MRGTRITLPKEFRPEESSSSPGGYRGRGGFSQRGRGGRGGFRGGARGGGRMSAGTRKERRRQERQQRKENHRRYHEARQNQKRLQKEKNAEKKDAKKPQKSQQSAGRKTSSAPADASPSKKRAQTNFEKLMNLNAGVSDEWDASLNKELGYLEKRLKIKKSKRTQRLQEGEKRGSEEISSDLHSAVDELFGALEDLDDDETAVDDDVVNHPLYEKLGRGEDDVFDDDDENDDGIDYGDEEEAELQRPRYGGEMDDDDISDEYESGDSEDELLRQQMGGVEQENDDDSDDPDFFVEDDEGVEPQIMANEEELSDSDEEEAEVHVDPFQMGEETLENTMKNAQCLSPKSVQKHQVRELKRVKGLRKCPIHRSRSVEFSDSNDVMYIESCLANGGPQQTIDDFDFDESSEEDEWSLEENVSGSDDHDAESDDGEDEDGEGSGFEHDYVATKASEDSDDVSSNEGESSDNAPPESGESDEEDEDIESDDSEDDEDDEEEVAEPSRGKYVPPSKRTASVLDSHRKSPEYRALQSKIRGQMNRLSQTNIDSISAALSAFFTGNSKNDVIEIMADLIIQSCCLSGKIQPDVVTANVGVVFILHQTVGVEVGAMLLETIAKKFNELNSTDFSAYHSLFADEEVTQEDVERAEEDTIRVDRLRNMMNLFAYLYNLEIVHHTFIFSLLKCLYDRFEVQDVDMIQKTLKDCGFKLRHDDPVQFKELVLALNAKVAAIRAARGSHSQKTRIDFLMEFVNEIKNNKKRQSEVDREATMATFKKQLKSTVKQLSPQSRNVNFSENLLRIKYNDLLASGSRGRWWIVGGAWEGDQHGDDDSAASSGRKKMKLQQTTLPKSEQLDTIAREQRMNSDVKRAIFSVLMSSDDYMNAFEKLCRLGLQARQEREIIRVIVECCGQERVYNPFYGYVILQFCKYKYDHKVTLQFVFWDQFKTIEEMPIRRLSNLASLLGFFLSEFALSPAVFKTMEFDELSDRQVLFLRLTFMHLLVENDSDCVAHVFQRVNNSADLFALRSGLQTFLRTAMSAKHSCWAKLFPPRLRSSDAVFRGTLQLLQKNARLAIHAMDNFLDVTGGN